MLEGECDMKHEKVTLPRFIKNHTLTYDMAYASIKYGKYLVIKTEGINDNNVREPICLKFIVTLHHDLAGKDSYSYQFSNDEIVQLLEGQTVTKTSREHLIDSTFYPFSKYDNQTRPTIGKLDATLNANDLDTKKAWSNFVDSAQFDQGLDDGMIY